MARSTVRFWFSIIVIPTFLVVAVLGYFAWRQSVPGVRAILEPVPRWIGVVRSRGASRVAVGVGPLSFRAYPAGPADSNLHVAIVALPWNYEVGTPIAAIAQDEAGNTTTRNVAVEVKGRRFRSDVIDVKDDFLERKLPELLPERGGVIPRD